MAIINQKNTIIYNQLYILHNNILYTALYNTIYCTIQYYILHYKILYTALHITKYCTIQYNVLHYIILYTAPYITIYCTIYYYIIRYKIYTAVYITIYCNIHCLMCCKLLTEERRILFNQVEQYIPKYGCQSNKMK